MDVFSLGIYVSDVLSSRCKVGGRFIYMYEFWGIWEKLK